MKKYESPIIKIDQFDLKDVITLSAFDPFADLDDVINAPSSWF